MKRSEKKILTMLMKSPRGYLELCEDSGVPEWVVLRVLNSFIARGYATKVDGKFHATGKGLVNYGT